MKYFVVTDIHGYYDEMITALNDAGFDAAKDTLINLGDAMDRGPKPVEVLKYLNSLPHKILIRGNHEDLFEQLCQKDQWDGCDKSNGTVKTVEALGNDWCVTNHVQRVPYMSHMYFKVAAVYAKKNQHWLDYQAQLVDYFETDHYIFVHGWIPTIQFKYPLTQKWLYGYMKDWRWAEPDEWATARWTDGCDCTDQKIFHPCKTIVCGHMSTSYWHTKFEGAAPYSDFSPYKTETVIALDGCVPLSHKVNVVILND